MHHTETSGKRTCTMRGSVPSNDVTLTSLLSIDGYLTSTTPALFGWQAASAPRPDIVSNFASRFVPPDPPPPRA